MIIVSVEGNGQLPSNEATIKINKDKLKVVHVILQNYMIQDPMPLGVGIIFLNMIKSTMKKM